MSDKTKVFLCCNVDEMIEDLGERNFTRGLTKWVRLADYESLTARLAAAEAALEHAVKRCRQYAPGGVVWWDHTRMRPEWFDGAAKLIKGEKRATDKSD